MAIGIAQTATVSYSLSVSFNIVFSGNATAGNGIIVAVMCTTTTTFVTNVTDNQGNYYYFAFRNTGSSANMEYWYCPKVVGGSILTISITNALSAVGGAIAREYSGFLVGITPDKSAMGSGASAAPASAAVRSTTGVPAIAIGIVGQVGTSPVFSLGSGYSNLQLLTGGSNQYALEDQILTSNGTPSASFGSTVSGNWSCAVATFKDAPSPTTNNNYQSVKVGDGMSTGEKIR